MNIDELNLYFSKHNLSSYERENYDKFLKHMNFSCDIKAIHITGTNGKGSTANYLYNIYLKEGYKVGLYCSPYLETVTEMVSINGINITDEEYINLFLEYKDELEKYRLSSFEMQTFIAYTFFKKSNLDLIIVEVGMGGFVDATNVINPILSIITCVSLEHTAYLGRSISEIAYNKAGIIKYEVPVLVGKLEDTALYAIREYAKDMKAPITIVEDHHNDKVNKDGVTFDYRPYKDISLSTKAIYQCDNAALAIEATKILKEQLPISEESVRKGLRCLTPSCRFEYLNDHLLLDGAHNPHGIEQLVNALGQYETRPIHTVFASFKDKNIDLMLISLSNNTSDVTLTSFNHPRARKEEDYFLYLGDYSFEADYLKVIKDLQEKFPDDVVLVTGSLAFAGLVKSVLKNA